MTAVVNESDSSLTNKCLELCHALAGQGKDFKFSLTIGSTFTFSLDSREGKETPPTRKKKSPSSLRRNAKRREDFLKKKPTSESASATGLESNQLMLQRQEFQCDECDFKSKSENGLKIHKGKSHKEVPTPEKLRKPSTQPSLLVSPTRNEKRMEPCHNCDMDMSPTHLCQNEEDSEVDEVPEAPIICSCGCGAPERCPRHFEVMESRKQMLNLILEQRKKFNFK